MPYTLSLAIAALAVTVSAVPSPPQYNKPPPYYPAPANPPKQATTTTAPAYVSTTASSSSSTTAPAASQYPQPKPPNYSVPGYTGVDLHNGAILAPTDEDCYTYITEKIWNDGQAFSPQRCVDACEAETKYNEEYLNSRATCRFVNTYILSKNGVSQGQVCAMYTRAWDASYATNFGSSSGSDKYTISTSWSYSNDKDAGDEKSCIAPLPSTHPTEPEPSPPTYPPVESPKEPKPQPPATYPPSIPSPLKDSPKPRPPTTYPPSNPSPPKDSPKPQPPTTYPPTNPTPPKVDPKPQSPSTHPPTTPKKCFKLRGWSPFISGLFWDISASTSWSSAGSLFYLDTQGILRNALTGAFAIKAGSSSYSRGLFNLGFNSQVTSPLGQCKVDLKASRGKMTGYLGCGGSSDFFAAKGGKGLNFGFDWMAKKDQVDLEVVWGICPVL